MNPAADTSKAWGLGVFFVRHCLAPAVTVAVPCVLWTVAYFVLFIWAAAAGGGMGSPVTYPIGLVFILIGGTAVAIVLFLPSTAMAEWFARRRGFPVMAQIPIALAIFTVIFVAIAGLFAISARSPLRDFLIAVVFLFVAHLLPLGLYWWTAQIGPLLRSLLQRLGLTVRR